MAFFSHLKALLYNTLENVYIFILLLGQVLTIALLRYNLHIINPPI